MSDKKHVIHALLGAISIFVIGVVVGVLIDRAALAPWGGSGDLHAQQTAVSGDHDRFITDIRHDIGLSEEQAGRVHEVLIRHQAAVDEAWSVVHTRLQAAIDSVTAEIERLLDPEQREALHEWLLVKHGLSSTHGADEGR